MPIREAAESFQGSFISTMLLSVPPGKDKDRQTPALAGRFF
jgi:hypothetical protein